jgi:hypothetical protein
VAGIKRRAIYRPRNCKTCGCEFLSRSSKKIYCDECLRARERLADRERAEKNARDGGVRAIGSTQVCKNCGGSFVLTVGTMKYCEPCREDRVNRWKRERRAEDPKFDLVSRIRRGINSCLGNGNKAFRTWESLVGYSYVELKEHLEKQFKPGMTWDNRSDWHIDHIRPVDSFDFDNAEDDGFKECWALTNLRPLWEVENKKKSAKLLYLI